MSVNTHITTAFIDNTVVSRYSCHPKPKQRIQLYRDTRAYMLVHSDIQNKTYIRFLFSGGVSDVCVGNIFHYFHPKLFFSMMEESVMKHTLDDGDDTQPSKRTRLTAMEYTHLCCDMNEVKDELRLNGVAIVPNAVGDELCDMTINQIWTAMESLVPVQRNNPETYVNLQQQLLPSHGGLFQCYHLGHLKSIWDIRLTCVPLFQQLWDTQDLCCSFDGIYFKPPSRLGIYRQKNWYHIDQGSIRIGEQNWQGAVNLVDNLDSNSACLSVFMKSHLHHTDYLTQNPDKNDFVQIDEDYYLQKQSVAIANVRAPKGALVLWDSKTVHMGKPPLTATAPLRSVVYVSMMPRNICHQAHKKRLKYFKERRILSHWCDVARVFGRLPQYLKETRLKDKNWMDIPGILRQEEEGAYMSLV